MNCDKDLAHSISMRIIRRWIILPLRMKSNWKEIDTVRHFQTMYSCFFNRGKEAMASCMGGEEEMKHEITSFLRLFFGNLIF